MNNPVIIEACYKKYMENLPKWLPDGLIDVDIEVLHRQNLLHYHAPYIDDASLTRYFHVSESEGKLTLVNDQFVIWIVPMNTLQSPATYTLIALNRDEVVQLELGFVTNGVYNNSQLVLRLLEKFLLEIQSTETFISKLA